MILVDTWVWIDHMRGESSPVVEELRRLMRDDRDSLAMCEPIAMELLAGASPLQLPSVEKLVAGLVSLETVPATHYRHAAAIYRAVRSTGHTVRGLNDCLIAAITISNDAELLHKDKDFERMAAYTPLRTVTF